jgi:hypothetical protein
MNKQGFGKQLQREIKANPVKAGVLALVLLVALWFWAPLVVGLFGGGSKPKKPAVAAAPVAGQTGGTGMGVHPAGTASTTQQPKWNPSWREVKEWIGKNPRMAPATPIDSPRDPFRAVAPPASREQVKKPDVPKLDMENLGLELTGTLIGPRRSVAMINGRAYALVKSTGSERQAPLKFTLQQQDQTYEFTLISIAPGRVELRYQDQPITLLAKDKQVTQKMIELNERSTIELHGQIQLP